MISLAVSLETGVTPVFYVAQNNLAMLEDHYAPILAAIPALCEYGLWQEDNAP